MPKGLKRRYCQKHLHFVTFCCYQRRRYLDTVRARSLFVKVLAEVRAKYGFFLVGYVVMPDHVHLFVAFPPTGITLSQWMQALRSVLGKELLRLGFQKPHWQEGFFDHVLRSAESYAKKICPDESGASGIVREIGRLAVSGRDR